MLPDLQRRFAGFVRHGDPAVTRDLRRDIPPARLAVYRNTVIGSLADVLGNAHPTVRRILGADAFAEFARRYVAAFPPDRPMLWAYGAGFAAWADGRPELPPWGAALARLDWAMQEALFAADADPLDPARLAAVPPDRVGGMRLMPHPSVRLVRSPWSVLAVWKGAAEAPPEPEAVLIGRSGAEVVCVRLSAEDGAMAACVLDGLPLAVAAETGGDLQGLLGRLLRHGLIVGFVIDAAGSKEAS